LCQRMQRTIGLKLSGSSDDTVPWVEIALL
jgi:hypothetical protein